MSVRRFLTWYIVATLLVGASGASVLHGLKWQHAQRVAALSTESPTPSVPAMPRQDIASAEPALPPAAAPPEAAPLPALRVPHAAPRLPPLREHVASDQA